MSKLICITNRHLVQGDFISRIADILLSSYKPDVIILREKDLSVEKYTALAEEVNFYCKKFHTNFVVHNFIETAFQLNLKAIHFPLPKLEKLTEEQKNYFNVIGASAHSPEQAVKSQNLGATYLTVSHIFETDCKKGLKPKGINLIENVKKSVNIPVYALGGINAENAPFCMQAGADGVCIMSGFMRGNISTRMI